MIQALPYLQRSDGNHRYHTQCQMQMVVTVLKTCCLLVWTPHGSFLETIETIDAEFWADLQQKISDFYVNYLESNMV